MIRFADNCGIYVSSTDPGGILENTHPLTHRENAVSPHSRTPTVWLLLLIPRTPHTSLLYFLLRQGHSGHPLSLLPGQIPLLLGGPVQLPSTWQSLPRSLWSSFSPALTKCQVAMEHTFVANFELLPFNLSCDCKLSIYWGWGPCPLLLHPIVPSTGRYRQQMFNCYWKNETVKSNFAQ